MGSLATLESRYPSHLLLELLIVTSEQDLRMCAKL